MAITDADISRHEPLILIVLRRMGRASQLAGHAEHDDLMQVGRIAVWKALQRHDPARSSFATFASQMVWGDIMHYQRESGRPHGWHRDLGQIAHVDSLHRPLNTGQTVGDTLIAPDDTERTALDRARLSMVLRVARGLRPAERVAARYMLTDRPQTDVMDALDCSQMHASRLSRRVRAKLAAA